MPDQPSSRETRANSGRSSSWGYTEVTHPRGGVIISQPGSFNALDLPYAVIDEGNQVIAVLPAEPRSAQHARSLVMIACSRWDAETVCADTELVVTELVANAVRHAGTEITLRLAALTGASGGVRAEVSDSSTRPVRPRHAGSMEEGGRGLFLVDVLSSQWGATATRDGKTIWAEIVPDGS